MLSRRSRTLIVGGTLAAGAVGAFARLGMKPDSQLFGETLVAAKEPDEIALTYDDGPNGRFTMDLLDVLARFQARATFFMVGKFLRQQPEVARAVHAAGHLIGNHTMTHPFLASKPAAFVEEELRGCSALLEDVVGAPIRYFRAPFGARRPAVLRTCRELGMTPVQWNVQGNDWEPIGASGILRRVESGLARARRRGVGANVLLHDGFDREIGYDRTDTVRATELLLLKAREQGRRVVTVDAWG